MRQLFIFLTLALGVVTLINAYDISETSTVSVDGYAISNADTEQNNF